MASMKWREFSCDTRGKQSIATRIGIIWVVNVATFAFKLVFERNHFNCTDVSSLSILFQFIWFNWILLSFEPRLTYKQAYFQVVGKLTKSRNQRTSESKIYRRKLSAIKCFRYLAKRTSLEYFKLVASAWQIGLIWFNFWSNAHAVCGGVIDVRWVFVHTFN